PPPRASSYTPICIYSYTTSPPQLHPPPLHDALPISRPWPGRNCTARTSPSTGVPCWPAASRSSAPPSSSNWTSRRCTAPTTPPRRPSSPRPSGRGGPVPAPGAVDAGGGDHEGPQRLHRGHHAFGHAGGPVVVHLEQEPQRPGPHRQGHGEGGRRPQRPGRGAAAVGGQDGPQGEQ